MPFNINDFKANIEDYGYLKTNLFEVYMQPPNILFGNTLNNNGIISQINELTDLQTFRIDQVRAPGISLASADVSRYGAGPTQKQPFNAQFNESSFSVLCDNQASVWQYWYNWVRAIYEFNGTDSAEFGEVNRFATYLSEYKSNYSTMMQIVMYDLEGNTIQRINLYEAFPTAIRDIPLAWADDGNMIKIDVNIAYTDYTIESSVFEEPMRIFF
jgi:hypothetical protein